MHTLAAAAAEVCQAAWRSNALSASTTGHDRRTLPYNVEPISRVGDPIPDIGAPIIGVENPMLRCRKPMSGIGVPMSRVRMPTPGWTFR